MNKCTLILVYCTVLFKKITRGVCRWTGSRCCSGTATGPPTPRWLSSSTRTTTNRPPSGSTATFPSVAACLVPWRRVRRARSLCPRSTSRSSRSTSEAAGVSLRPTVDGQSVEPSAQPSASDKRQLNLSGPDLRGGANWAVAQGPPQVMGLHKKQ